MEYRRAREPWCRVGSSEALLQARRCRAAPPSMSAALPASTARLMSQGCQDLLPCLQAEVDQLQGTQAHRHHQ